MITVETTIKGIKEIADRIYECLKSKARLSVGDTISFYHKEKKIFTIEIIKQKKCH